MPASTNVLRERSHRLPLACYQGEVAVAFTARLTAGSPPLTGPDVVHALIAALGISARHHKCTVPIYCFMPNHLHVILQGTVPDADTWKAMGAFKQRSGYWFRRYCPDTRWQKDFYDHILRDEGDVRDAIVYVASNPLRAGLARDPREYPYTGAIDLEPTEPRDPRGPAAEDAG